MPAIAEVRQQRQQWQNVTVGGATSPRSLPIGRGPGMGGGNDCSAGCADVVVVDDDVDYRNRTDECKSVIDFRMSVGDRSARASSPLAGSPPLTGPRSVGRFPGPRAGRTLACSLPIKSDVILSDVAAESEREEKRQADRRRRVVTGGCQLQSKYGLQRVAYGNKGTTSTSDRTPRQCFSHFLVRPVAPDRVRPTDRLTDWQTDGRTDGRTGCEVLTANRSIYRWTAAGAPPYATDGQYR